MTYPKMKPCPKCGAEVILWTYESGWSRVECDGCDSIFSCKGSKLDAIREHNAKIFGTPPVIARTTPSV